MPALHHVIQKQPSYEKRVCSPQEGHCFTSFFHNGLLGGYTLFTAGLFSAAAYLINGAYLIFIILRHTIVCHATQETSAPHREYINRKNYV